VAEDASIQGQGEVERRNSKESESCVVNIPSPEARVHHTSMRCARKLRSASAKGTKLSVFGDRGWNAARFRRDSP
jgi:hypothetical protein